MCPSYKLDFDDSALKEGQYITTELLQEYHVSITAAAESVMQGMVSPTGYTPAGAARIFNTANPGSSLDGDLHLGSPNIACGGPGIGDGGMNSSQFSNCVPLGNVLIIQKEDKAQPDDNRYGGNLTFTFELPAYVEDIAILDIDENSPLPEIHVKTMTGEERVYSTMPVGRNGYYTMKVAVDAVDELRVHFPGSGAVAEINYMICPPSGSPSLSPLSSLAPSSLPTRQGDPRSGIKSPTDPGLYYNVSCMEDVYQEETRTDTSLVCRAKEVTVDDVSSPVAKTCKKGETVIVDIMASVRMESQRFDFGWYIATDGGDALTGTCAVKSLEEPSKYDIVPSGSVSWTGDVKGADVCGDVIGGNALTIENAYLAKDLEIVCEDANNDGYLDFAICFSWRDAITDDVCDPQALFPGSVTACDCATYDVAKITVVDNTHSTCL